MHVPDFQASIEAALSGSDEPHLRALEAIAHHFSAATATLHTSDAATATLRLVASLGLPEKIRQISATIPFGKGMAGICAERREPVTVCNLQTDCSGVARPAAKETGVAGAIVMPILSSEGVLLGTLGLGRTDAHEYTREETETLASCARLLASRLS